MPTTGFAPGRILVVVDQPADTHGSGELLARNGYDVQLAASPGQALGLAQAHAPDLVLLDLAMPGDAGSTLLAELKRQPGFGRVPVLFLAEHDRDLLLRAFAAGAVDFVARPYQPEELLARVGAHVKLKLALDRLERFGREREELVSLVAHDLKNPLSTILFASDMLRTGACKPERVPRYLQTIHESAQDAIAYIGRYLETQQAQSARPPREASTSLQDAAGWLVHRYELQLEGHGMRLSATGLDPAARVAVDALVLRQVLENLVSNALKYAPGSDLELSVHAGAPGHWRVQLDDRGPGIPPARRRDLFKPFVRLQDDKDDLSSGLGLSLARRIVSQAGGQLWYEDREGGGARFVIELPEAAPSGD